MNPASTSLQQSSFKALPTLYSDIISTIISFVALSEDSQEDLLTLALVSREWYQLCRRYSFTQLGDLWPVRDLLYLRQLIELNNGATVAELQTSLHFGYYVRSA